MRTAQEPQSQGMGTTPSLSSHPAPHAQSPKSALPGPGAWHWRWDLAQKHGQQQQSFPRYLEHSWESSGTQGVLISLGKSPLISVRNQPKSDVLQSKALLGCDLKVLDKNSNLFEYLWIRP